MRSGFPKAVRQGLLGPVYAVEAEGQAQLPLQTVPQANCPPPTETCPEHAAVPELLRDQSLGCSGRVPSTGQRCVSTSRKGSWTHLQMETKDLRGKVLA